MESLSELDSVGSGKVRKTPWSTNGRDSANCTASQWETHSSVLANQWESEQ